MKLADAALLGALGVLAWSQWQEWRLNRDVAIDIPYHGVPTASLWQCGLLIKEMAALAEQVGEERSDPGARHCPRWISICTRRGNGRVVHG